MKTSRLFTPEQQDFIAKHIQGRLIRELTDVFNEHYGTNFTMNQFECYAKNHKLHSGFGNHWNRGRSLFTPEQKQFIRDNAKGRTNKELSDLMLEVYGEYFSTTQLQSYKKHNGILTGLTGRFQKGMTRDGVPIVGEELEKMKAHRFLPGRECEIKAPVGTIVPNHYGYLKEKVADPDVWEYVHHKVWRKHHGEIPKGCVVTFVNGDKNDCRIENLVLCTRQGHLLLNRLGLYREPEVVKLAEDIAQVEAALKERKKDKNDG